MLSSRRSTLFLVIALWVGCHVVSGLDELTVGDEGGGLSGPSTSGSAPGAGGMSTSSGMGATGGVCDNDCCCPHPNPFCSGGPVQAQSNQDVPAGGAGGVIAITTGGGTGGTLTSQATSVGPGGMSTGTGPAELCTNCVCGFDPSCCDMTWSENCAGLAGDPCGGVCGCPGL